MNSENVKALVDLGISLREIKATIDRLKGELSEARGIIRKAEGMVNGYADNDYRIAVEILRPYMAKYPEGA
ncbi:MAG: hypothetical protein ACOVRP_02440 [Gemmatimonas sp.]